MLPDCSKFPNQNVQMFWCVFHDTKWQKPWGKIEDHRGTSWTKLVRSSISPISMGKTIRRNFIRTWVGKFRIGNVCLFIVKQGLLLSVYVDDKKWLERSRIWLSCWRNWMKKRWSRRTHIISWPRVLGMQSAWMQTEWNNHWTIYEDVWVTCFCWSNRKITGVAKTSRTNSSVVLRHGGTCSKMRWAILRIGKKKKKTEQL